MQVRTGEERAEAREVAGAGWGGAGGGRRDGAKDAARPGRAARHRREPVEDVEEVVILDDRAVLDHARGRERRPVLLVVEDDPTFAQILIDQCREQGFKALLATGGHEALELARRYRPDAITLDLLLPDLSGWQVLDRLKHDPELSAIPVTVISAEDAGLRARAAGALTALQKPVDRDALGGAFRAITGFLDRPIRRLLVVEDDAGMRQSIVELIGHEDVETRAVKSGAEALAALSEDPYDCVVLDLGLPDVRGLDLLEQLRERRFDLPVIVYTGRELTAEEERRLRTLARSIVLKGVTGPERLLAETTVYLHREPERLPRDKRELLRRAQREDPVLLGRRVLVVDDDVRNLYALTSVLEPYGVEVVFAENGREGVRRVESDLAIDLVLMDVMMPEMDGLEATRRIREQERFTTLPIIALTAKAMRGDREACLDAGASDYVTKPIDPEQLLSLLRVWLYR